MEEEAEERREASTDSGLGPRLPRHRTISLDRAALADPASPGEVEVHAVCERRRSSFGSAMDLVELHSSSGDAQRRKSRSPDGDGINRRKQFESPGPALDSNDGDLDRGRSGSSLGKGSTPPGKSKSPSKRISMENQLQKLKTQSSYQTKLRHQLARDVLYIIFADGNTEMKDFSVRELFNYINVEVMRANVLESGPSVPAALGALDLARPGYRSSVQFHSHAGITPAHSFSRLSPSCGGRGGSSSSHHASPSLSTASAYRPQPGESGFCLHHRDLRQLFSNNSAREPYITIRRNVVLVNLETVRAVVLFDRILLLVEAGADSVFTRMERELMAMSGVMPEFEMRAYEALLSLSTSELTKEIKTIEPLVREVVLLMEDSGSHAATSAAANDKFRSLMNEVNELDSRAKARRRALLGVLEDDSELSFMNLTKVQRYPEQYIFPLSPEVGDDHEEVELLFESFLQEVNSLGNVLEIMRDRMHNTESLIMVRLDIARNQLLTASTVFSMVAMSLGFGSLWAGIFGMNLTSGVEDEPGWFVGVTLAITLSALSIGTLTFTYLQWKGIWVK